MLGGGLDDHNTYWSKQPRLNKGCLLAETRELPWDRQVEMRQMRLYCTLLKAGPESLAGSMMRGLKGNPRALKKNKCIARAVKTAKAWGVRPRPLASKNEVQVWKKDLRLRARRAGRKELEAAQVELDVKVRGDTMLLGSLSKGWGETGKRAVLFPHRETRVYLCRLLYGHARGLREPIIKYARSSNKLTQTRRMYLEHCPCQRGNQTASHMWQTCAETDTMRIEALGQANDTVMEQGSDRDRDLWGRMGGSERFAHLVSTRRRMSLAVEVALRVRIGTTIVTGLTAAHRNWEGQNAWVNGYVATHV